MSEFDRRSLIKEIKNYLPDPVQEDTQLDGDFVLIGGDPGEVVLRLSGSRLSVAVYSVRWEGPHTPVVCPEQLATLNWKRLPASTTLVTLRRLIEAAIELRRSKYRKCEKCGKTIPPEWMQRDRICQSCEEQHLRVMY